MPYCENCGEELDSEWIECLYCGHRNGMEKMYKKISHISYQPQREKIHEVLNYVRCGEGISQQQAEQFSNLHKVLLRSDRIMPKSKQKISEKIVSREFFNCPFCHAKIKIGEDICSYCGISLKTEK